jgi:hypothetical protein
MKLEQLIGQRVIVDYEGVQVVARLISITGMRAIVQFPTEKKTRQVWRSKVSEIKPN